MQTMDRSFVHSQWKDRDSRGKDSTDQGDLPLIGNAPDSSPKLADEAFVSACSAVGAMRYAAQRTGEDDFEIADKVGISHSYMCKVLKGTAGLHGQRLVKFMHITESLAPLQWLAEQMGCDVVQRNARDARIARLEAALRAEKSGRVAA